MANANVSGSLDVARHYAAARGISEDFIAEIRSPSNYTIDWEQFELLRDQVIDFLIRETLADGAAPPPCANGEAFYCEEKLALVRNATTIRYVVLVRGVPTRFVPAGRNFRLSTLPTTVDSYLRYHLLNVFPESNAADPFRFPAGTNRERDFGDGSGMRTIDPARDHEFAIGRIDGITAESAMKLVDRTLSAEANGLFGKLYTTTFRHPNPALDAIISPDWIDERTRLPVYGSETTQEAGTSWRYQLGIWGASPDCTDHLDYGPDRPAGLSPEGCPVRINEPVDAPPGTRGSRVPTVPDAVAYLGALDGQSTTGTDGRLDVLARWRAADAECPLLCADLAGTDERAACAVTSLDVVHEINSSCVAVNEGFIGFNWISWPLSYFAVWPTGWAPIGNDPGDWMGGDFPLSLPTLRTDEGRGDRYSLWFGDVERSTPELCHVRGRYNGPDSATVPCEEEYRFWVGQRIDLRARPIRPGRAGSPQSVTLSFHVKPGEGFAVGHAERIDAWVSLHQSNGRVIALPAQSTGDIVAGSAWSQFTLEFAVDPERHSDCLDAGCGIESMSIHMRSALETGTFGGSVGLDDVALRLGTDSRNLIGNGRFDEGFRQLAVGDHAAVFLDRLGGVAFWGSAGHAVTGGHSFATHPVETLIYFLRGLPLGEAVWLHEELPTGILYGDPLYSPTAVRLDYAPADRASGAAVSSFDLFGTVVNGRNSDFVSTAVRVDYCGGTDWFVCDEAGSWQPVLAGAQERTGSSRPDHLGRWETSALPDGAYTLRLAVTTTNVNRQSRSYGKAQTFADYRIVPAAMLRAAR